MNIIIILKSKHMGNTRKLAEAMAEVAPITIVELENASSYKLSDYDIVGFGSGIYFGKHDKELIEYVSERCDKKAYAFVFSTSGSGNFDKNNKPLVDLLESKNKVVLGTFGCKAFDKYGPFKLVGGINKGHPDKNDFIAAQNWIKDIVKKYQDETEQ